MKDFEVEIFEAWQHGESFGSIAKRYKLDKQKVRGIVNRAGQENIKRSAEMVYELPDEATVSGWDGEEE